MQIDFRIDDLSGEVTRALIARHLQGMYASSPAESVHAFGIEKLQHPDVRFWSAWVVGQLAGCGALKHLDNSRAEIKSMRVADEFLGRGVGRSILQHLMREARESGYASVWLETGATEPFIPALRLYESTGFVRCGPF